MRKQRLLRGLIASTTFTIFMTAIPARSQTVPAPLLSYNFNEGSGTTATNSGTAFGAASGGVTIPADLQLFSNVGTGVTADLHGASGSGLSGMAGDYALNLSAPTGQGSNGNGPQAARVTRPQIQSLKSFTLSGFFKADEIIGANARLFSLSDNSGNTPINVSATSNGVLGLNVGPTGGTSSGTAAYTAVGQYEYFAITYDGTSTNGNVSFYVGTTGPGATLSLVSTQTLANGTVPTPGDPFFLFVGANNSAVRQFDGLLDNIQVYGSAADNTGALSQAQVGAVYASFVPEPASMGIVCAVVPMLLARRRRRSI